MYKAIPCLLLFMICGKPKAQSDSLAKPIQFGGYIENYYSYDFAQPDNHERPSFLYSYNRHNEVALNLGYLKATYTEKKVVASLALMAGTYANANLAGEPGVLKNIFEAYIGVKLSEKDLWLYAGTFSSHIGFEGAVGKDCWNLSRSMLAENSPYYESGVKINYTSNNSKWFLSGLILNGWQRMQRIDGSNSIAGGHQITYKPSKNFAINSSSFVGNMASSGSKFMRYFHNLYGQIQISDEFGCILGFDIGAQDISMNGEIYKYWYSPVFIARYSAAGKVLLAVRLEYYNDENGVIIETLTNHGFQTLGYSFNMDFIISPSVMWRVERRAFSSKDEIFINQSGVPSNTNAAITTSLSIAF
jgi:Putative beta-barrel porin-2, OmpL-like. bbp2